MTLNGYYIVGFVHGRKVSDLHKKFHELLRTTFVLLTRERFVKLIFYTRKSLIQTRHWRVFGEVNKVNTICITKYLNIIILGRLGK